MANGIPIKVHRHREEIVLACPYCGAFDKKFDPKIREIGSKTFRSCHIPPWKETYGSHRCESCGKHFNG